MIELKHVYKSFDGCQVLNDLSLKLVEGESVCLFGSIGCGKSTLLRCLAGLEQLDSGEIVFSGGERPRIGMIFQQFNLFPFLTVLHNLTLAPKQVLGMSTAEAERIAMAQLDSIGLAHKSHLFPHELSAGQQQRVAIARALVMKPQILLIDEPLSSLDPISRGEVMDVLRKLKSEITLVISTHDIQAASELADRIAILDEGYICEDGSVDEVLTSPRQEATRRLLSYMRDLHYTIESVQFDRPELNSRIEQFCSRYGLNAKASRYVQLVVEESLNLVPLEGGARLQLAKMNDDMRMMLDIVTDEAGVLYADESTCRDDLSLSILRGLCDVLEERVEGSMHILHMELSKARLQ
ncbi:MAG: amino acid ABC transporter ATP-binding protein [Alistipes sp.]|nr:amino acid ABC transporter ATP-binding protein [Alistipes sp.]